MESSKGPEIQAETDLANLAGLTNADHHLKQKFCACRPKYRQGKELKAVKVYTINDESNHLLLQNIPNVGLAQELQKLCQRFGKIKKFSPVPPATLIQFVHPQAPFTTVFYIKFATLREARYAKTKLDNRSFYGEIIHVHYVPELESVEETRAKLNSRRHYAQMYNKKRSREKQQ